MSRMPTDEQFDTALMWLAANEGDNGEAEACKAVADWLDLELNRRQKNGDPMFYVSLGYSKHKHPPRGS